jgi:Lipocalin-like domain
MKKITLLFVSIISFGLATVSCSKKDSETSIEGKWVYSQNGSIVNGQEVLIPYPHAPNCEKDYTTLIGGVTKDYTHRNVNGVCQETIGSGTYTRNGSELKVTVSGEVYAGTIKNLTDSELKISDGTRITVFTKG